MQYRLIRLAPVMSLPHNTLMLTLPYDLCTLTYGVVTWHLFLALHPFTLAWDFQPT